MSNATATRIPLAEAANAAAWLMRRWAMTEPDCAMVGSIRRRRVDVGDLDFIAPLPEDPKRTDPLYDAIAMSLGLIAAPAGLFHTPPPQGPQLKGRVVNGLAPGFKGCALIIAGQSGRELPVNIGRYQPGREGNRGWTEVRLTGPREFGKALLTQWKVVCGTAGDETFGSDKGFLVDRLGQRVATPTEVHVFHAARCIRVAPELRGDDTLMSIDWLHPDAPIERRLRMQKAMAACQTNPDEVAQAWKDQTLALAGWRP